MSELISNINVFPTKHDRLLANVSFAVAEAFVVRAKVVKTKDGMMVSMPSENYMKDGEKVYKDMVFPVTKEARAEMTKKVIEAYKEEVGKSGGEKKSGGPKKSDKVPF
jgi:DNA-binding cell septation regulator SpoVG